VIFGAVIGVSGTLSLATLVVALVAVLAAGFVAWRAGSVKALRDDIADWEKRYTGAVADREELKQDNHRLEQKVADVTAQCNSLAVEVGRLQGMTDTTALARQDGIESFRAEVIATLARLEAHDEKKFQLISESQGMIRTLIERDPALRTRSTDHR
jgi:predicted nuclease with TOPRIM domain